MPRDHAICIHAEQGFGDTIQFARYLPLVQKRAGAVAFRLQHRLARLMRQSFDGIEIVSGPAMTAARGDCGFPLLSLPRLFDTRLENIPAAVPYLRADPDEAASWRAAFGDLRGVKVGLAWAGNPDHVNDPRRTIGLTPLAHLFRVPGVDFVSLQVGARAADVAQHHDFSIRDISADLSDFGDTAAAIEALDLVITVDSVIAHLAGALAKPVWLLNPWVSDWRWMLGCETSPWYPTMRIFRQAAGQGWREVAARVSLELRKVVHGDTATFPPALPAEFSPPPDPKHFADAVARARRAVERNPACADGWADLGNRLRLVGNNEEAMVCLRRAVEIDPDNASAHVGIGVLLLMRGEFAEGWEHYEWRELRLA